MAEGLFIIFAVGFVAIFFGVTVVTAWKWTRSAGFKTFWGRVGCFIGMFSPLIIIFNAIKEPIALWMYYIYFIVSIPPIYWLWVCGLACIFWVTAMFVIYAYPRTTNWLRSRIVGFIVGLFALGLIWLASFMLCVMVYGPTYFLYLWILIYLSDRSAYFIDKHFGKHKFASHLNSNKTVEGVMGVLLITFIISCIGYIVIKPYPVSKLSFLLWVLLNVVTVFFSIVGDLLESIYRHIRNVKINYSVFFLDRIFGLSAAFAFFLMGMYVIFILFGIQHNYSPKIWNPYPSSQIWP